MYAARPFGDWLKSLRTRPVESPRRRRHSPNIPTSAETLEKREMLSGAPVLVQDINIGPEASFPSSLHAHGDKLLFSATDSTNGTELWISDGTADGTLRLTDVDPGTGSPFISVIGALGDKTLFLTSVESVKLWATDGTPEGTTILTDANYNEDSATRTGDRFFFLGEDVDHGEELWVTDGTAAGTKLVKDVWPGPAGSASGSFLVNMVAVGDKVYFTADDGTNGEELWVSDGTDEGTILLEIWPGSSSSVAGDLTPVGDRLFFTAFNETNGGELWVTDGTIAGTVPLEVVPGIAGSIPSPVTRVGDRVFFFASGDGNGIATELWVSDGTQAGTSFIRDMKPGATSSGFLGRQVVVGNRLFFVIEDDNSGQWDLWVSDGTQAGTFALTDTPFSIQTDGFFGFSIYDFEVAGDTLFFTAKTDATGFEVWATDGTVEGTRAVKDINPGANGSNPFELTAVGDRVFFAAEEPTGGNELWVSDGTAAGTIRFDLRPGNDGSLIGRTMFSSHNAFTPFGDRLIFRATTNAGEEVWLSDGTSVGTLQVGDIRPGTSGSFSGLFTVVGSQVFFVADDGTHGQELWTLRENAAPTGVSLSSSTISEDSPAGTTVGTLTATDSDPGDSHTFSLVNDAGGRFVIEGNELKVAAGAVFNFATEPAIDVTVHATDSGGLTFEAILTVVITEQPVNAAPTGISLSSSSIPEDSPAGTTVGTLTATDPDAGDSHTFSLVNDAGGRFVIEGNELKVAAGAVFDFATEPTVAVTIQVTDAGGLTHESTLAIVVEEVDSHEETHVRQDLIGFHHGQWWVAASEGASFNSRLWGQWSDVEWDALGQGDFNGDGRTDVLGLLNGSWWVGLSTGTGFVTSRWAGWSNRDWKNVAVGDLNGDGQSDILASYKGQWWAALSNGTSFATPTRWTVWADIDWQHVSLVDLNADGSQDLIGYTHGAWWTTLSNGKNFEIASRWARWADIKWDAIGTFDANGDGRTDIYGLVNGQWFTGLATDAGFTTSRWMRWANVDWQNAVAGDFDGDGRDDLAARHRGRWWVNLTSDADTAGLTSRWAVWNDLPWQVQIGDFDGDGRDDIVGNHAGQWWVGRSTGSGLATSFWGRWANKNWQAMAAGDVDASPPVSAATSIATDTGSLAESSDEEESLSRFWSTAATDDELAAGLLATA